MSDERARDICEEAKKWRRHASRWEHVFQVTRQISVLSKPAPKATTGAAAGTVGGVWGLAANKPIPAAIGGFVAAVLALAQWLVPEDAANRHAFHLWRRAQYDVLIDEIVQRLSEASPVKDRENAAWGARVTMIRGSDYYRPDSWRDA